MLTRVRHTYLRAAKNGADQFPTVRCLRVFGNRQPELTTLPLDSRRRPTLVLTRPSAMFLQVLEIGGRRLQQVVLPRFLSGKIEEIDGPPVQEGVGSRSKELINSKGLSVKQLLNWFGSGS